MVVYGSGVVEINGKMGGDIWRFDWCRQHVQAAPRLINHVSPKQRARRNAFRGCVNYIRANFTQERAWNWQSYANRHPKIRSKGGQYTLTWWQQFIGVNINRVIEGDPILGDPPD